MFALKSNEHSKQSRNRLSFLGRNFLIKILNPRPINLTPHNIHIDFALKLQEGKQIRIKIKTLTLLLKLTIKQIPQHLQIITFTKIY